MNKKKYFIIIIIIFVYVFISLGQERVPIEELDIITGVGYDIEKKSEGMMEYILPLNITVYKQNGRQANLVIKEQAVNIGEVIQKRQQKMSKKFVQGQERIILISEEYAKQGIKTLMDDRFRNSEVNDMAFAAVCKGRPEEYFKYKVKGYNNSSEFMSGLIENAYIYDFFSDNYKLLDMYVRVGAEGRNLVLPYIELGENGILINGLAIFKEDKMIAKADLINAKILNLLKENNVKGIVSLENSSLEYIDFEGKTGTRKVKCDKQGEKYIFNINLNLSGTVINNSMYTEIIKDINTKRKFEKDMAKSIEKSCYAFLKIMQNEYKMDCIDLGKEAAAKFGRRKINDWSKIVSNATIKVNIKIKVVSHGRGDY